MSQPQLVSAADLLARLTAAVPRPVTALPVIEPLRLPDIFRLAFERGRALGVPYMTASQAIGTGLSLTLGGVHTHTREEIASLLSHDIKLWMEGRASDCSYLIDMDRLTFDLGLNIALGLLSGELPANPTWDGAYRKQAMDYAYRVRIYFGADDDAEDRDSYPERLCTHLLAYQEACEEYSRSVQHLCISATNAAFEEERTRLRA